MGAKPGSSRDVPSVAVALQPASDTSALGEEVMEVRVVDVRREVGDLQRRARHLKDSKSLPRRMTDL